jgi:hypothetical protein
MASSITWSIVFAGPTEALAFGTATATTAGPVAITAAVPSATAGFGGAGVRSFKNLDTSALAISWTVSTSCRRDGDWDTRHRLQADQVNTDSKSLRDLHGDADIRVSRHHSGIANRLITSQVYKVGYKEGVYFLLLTGAVDRAKS